MKIKIKKINKYTLYKKLINVKICKERVYGVTIYNYL